MMVVAEGSAMPFVAYLLGHTVRIESVGAGRYSITISGPVSTETTERSARTATVVQALAHAFAHSALGEPCECRRPVEWKTVD